MVDLNQKDSPGFEVGQDVEHVVVLTLTFTLTDLIRNTATSVLIQ